jgi:hypothetical protein
MNSTTDQNMPKENESDDIRHLSDAVEASRGDPSFELMVSIVRLLGEGLALIPRLAWSDVFANDLSATACLARAFRQLRAAITLMMSGYYAETYVILRGAHECAGAARMLAKQPDRADKWLRNQAWWPDREVRNWFADSPNSVRTSEEIKSSYSFAYRRLSRWSHPTALACLRLVMGDEDGPRLDVESKFAEDEFRDCVVSITGAALFSCFALRNAAVSEKAIDPQWRQRLYELARVITDSDMAHLERNWEQEQHLYDALQQRVQAADNLISKLRNDPRSWQNLAEPTSAEEPASSDR